MSILALVTTFTGVGLFIDRPKGDWLEWLALPLVVSGGAIFAWAVWPRAETSMPSSSYMLGVVLARLTRDGRLLSVFPAIGVGILLADLAYNLFLSSNSQLLTEDTIVILLGACFVGYRLVPNRYGRERDFVLAFFVVLNLTLVLPLLASRAYYQDFQRSVDVYSWVALAPETSAVLTLIGVSNSVHTVPGASAPGLTFVPQNLNVPVTVVITTACSGIYSFGVFASAFVAFVLTEYQNPSRRLWLFIALGVSLSYAANVLRMVAIVLVGYYTDTVQTDLQNLLLAHSYAGWLIFLTWVALFWSLLFRFVPPLKQLEQSADQKTRTEARCSVCGGVLTPSIPAKICECGRFYHTLCAVRVRSCPPCGRTITNSPSALEGAIDD